MVNQVLVDSISFELVLVHIKGACSAAQAVFSPVFSVFCPIQDGKLTREEILDKYNVFVGSQVTDFGEALLRHDEF